MAGVPAYKSLPAELEAELNTLFDASQAPHHLKHSITLEQRTDLEKRWPILLENKTLGFWWKGKHFELVRLAEGLGTNKGKPAKVEGLTTSQPSQLSNPDMSHQLGTLDNFAHSLHNSFETNPAVSSRLRSRVKPDPVPTASPVAARAVVATPTKRQPKTNKARSTKSVSVQTEQLERAAPQLPGLPEVRMIGSFGKQARVVPSLLSSIQSSFEPVLPSFPSPTPLALNSSLGPTVWLEHQPQRPATSYMQPSAQLSHSGLARRVEGLTSAPSQPVGGEGWANGPTPARQPGRLVAANLSSASASIINHEQVLSDMFEWAGSKTFINQGKVMFELYFSPSTQMSDPIGFITRPHYRVTMAVDLANQIRILGDPEARQTLLIFPLSGSTTFVEQKPAHTSPLASSSTTAVWQPCSLLSASFALVLAGGPDPACELEKVIASVDELSSQAGAVVRNQCAEGRWWSTIDRAAAVVLAMEGGPKESRPREEPDGHGGLQRRTILVYHLPNLNFVDAVAELPLELWGDPLPRPPTRMEPTWSRAAVEGSGSVAFPEAGHAPAPVFGSAGSTTAGSSSRFPSSADEPAAIDYSPTVAPSQISPQFGSPPMQYAPVSPVLPSSRPRATPVALAPHITPAPLLNKRSSVTLSPPSIKQVANERELSPSEARWKRKRTPLAPLPSVGSSSEAVEALAGSFEWAGDVAGGCEGRAAVTDDGCHGLDEGFDGVGAGLGPVIDYDGMMTEWNANPEAYLDAERVKRQRPSE